MNGIEWLAVILGTLVVEFILIMALNYSERNLGDHVQRFYNVMSRNQMWLFAITEIYYDDRGEAYNGKVLFCIRAEWLWNLLYGRNKK